MGWPITTTDATQPFIWEWFGLSTSIPFVRFDGPFDVVSFRGAGAYWGGSDTADFQLAWLNESAWSFNSTATAGIEDPDNEMGKLWYDTNTELRLTDTAGEDWFVTKSTSTGPLPRVLFHRAWIEDFTDAAPGSGWQRTSGSDTATQAESGEIVFSAGNVY